MTFTEALSKAERKGAFRFVIETKNGNNHFKYLNGAHYVDGEESHPLSQTLIPFRWLGRSDFELTIENFEKGYKPRI